MEQSEKWITDEMWELMNDDITNYVFEQGEKRLAELNSIADTISSRSQTVLGIIVAVYPFIIMSAAQIKTIYYSVLVALFAIVCICVSIYITRNLISPGDTKGVGASPRERLVLATLKNYNVRKEENFKKYEIESLQESIEFMLRHNKERANKYKIVIYILFGSFSLFLLLTCALILSSFYWA
jgi:hypothetical protein